MTFNVAWTAEIGVGTSSNSAITATPIVADGMVFTLDAAANVRVFDAASGGEIYGNIESAVDITSDFYSFSTGGDRAEEGYGGGLAYAGGRLFVTTGFREIIALDAHSGGRLVEAGRDAVPHSANGPGRPGHRDEPRQPLMGSGRGNQRRSVDARGLLGNGQRPGQRGYQAANAEYVVVPYTNGDLYALRSNNGRAVWTNR